MTLRDVIDKLADWVNFKVAVNEYRNIIAIYEDADNINNYLDCNVETIDTTEEGTLVVTVDGNTEE